jgi:hypothetical protein
VTLLLKSRAGASTAGNAGNHFSAIHERMFSVIALSLHHRHGNK